MNDDDDTGLDLDDELQQLLADEAHALDEDDLDIFRGFDQRAFLESLRDDGVLIHATALEVPLARVAEAQEACALRNMELHVDDFGHPYLMALLVSASSDERIVLASRSFAEIEPDEDEEG